MCFTNCPGEITSGHNKGNCREARAKKFPYHHCYEKPEPDALEIACQALTDIAEGNVGIYPTVTQYQYAAKKALRDIKDLENN